MLSRQHHQGLTEILDKARMSRLPDDLETIRRAVTQQAPPAQDRQRHKAQASSSSPTTGRRRSPAAPAP